MLFLVVLTCAIVIFFYQEEMTKTKPNYDLKRATPRASSKRE